MTKHEKSDVKHDNIAQALAAAQMEMGPALKDSLNPHFKSKYADLAAVMAACMPALNKHGIAVVQPMEYVQLSSGETIRVVETQFIHEGGEQIRCPVELLIGKPDMQGLGSAITYARRYGLMQLAGIAPEDDDGNAAANNPARSMQNGLKDSWRDSVLDNMPPNPTAEEKADAFTKAIIKDFQGKGAKALENAWERHKQMIASLEAKYPEMHGHVVDAYENEMMKATGQD